MSGPQGMDIELELVQFDIGNLINQSPEEYFGNQQNLFDDCPQDEQKQYFNAIVRPQELDDDQSVIYKKTLKEIQQEKMEQEFQLLFNQINEQIIGASGFKNSIIEKPVEIENPEEIKLFDDPKMINQIYLKILKIQNFLYTKYIEKNRDQLIQKVKKIKECLFIYKCRDQTRLKYMQMNQVNLNAQKKINDLRVAIANQQKELIQQSEKLKSDTKELQTQRKNYEKIVENNKSLQAEQVGLQFSDIDDIQLKQLHEIAVQSLKQKSEEQTEMFNSSLLKLEHTQSKLKLENNYLKGFLDK